jgi:predicted Fe-Mo cluster-binding NifX family protein
MKIAVASESQNQVTKHTGRCRRFWVYDIENGAICNQEFLQFSNQESFRKTSPHNSHPLDGIQVLIARKFGEGLIRHLESRGMQVITTTQTHPEVAVREYLNPSQNNKQLLPESDRHKGHHHQGHCQQHRKRGKNQSLQKA